MLWPPTRNRIDRFRSARVTSTAVSLALFESFDDTGNLGVIRTETQIEQRHPLE